MPHAGRPRGDRDSRAEGTARAEESGGSGTGRGERRGGRAEGRGLVRGMSGRGHNATDSRARPSARHPPPPAVRSPVSPPARVELPLSSPTQTTGTGRAASFQLSASGRPSRFSLPCAEPLFFLVFGNDVNRVELPVCYSTKPYNEPSSPGE